MRALSMVTICALALQATPALAGKLLQAAPEAMAEYAGHAGYMLSTIPNCGGNAEEETYFIGLARDNLVQIGADEDDLGYLDFEMAKAADSAAPLKKHCVEDFAVPLASELFRLRAEIEKKALKAE